MPQSYDVCRDEDGTYSVIWIATGQPVVIDGVPQIGLDIQDADEVAESLDNIDFFTRWRGSKTVN